MATRSGPVRKFLFDRSFDDPSKLFNSSLEGNVRRAIDFHEGDKLDTKEFAGLIKAAIAQNTK